MNLRSQQLALIKAYEDRLPLLLGVNNRVYRPVSHHECMVVEKLILGSPEGSRADDSGIREDTTHNLLSFPLKQGKPSAKERANKQ